MWGTLVVLFWVVSGFALGWRACVEWTAWWEAREAERESYVSITHGWER
jgi:hypothetical protein